MRRNLGLTGHTAPFSLKFCPRVFDSFEFSVPTMGGRSVVSITTGEGVLASGFGTSLEWRSSSWCDGGSCVEAAVQNNAVLLRGSTDPGGSILVFTHAAWRDLTARIKQIPSSASRLP